MSSRNPMLIKGVRTYGRSKAYSRKQQWKHEKKEGPKKKERTPKTSVLRQRYVPAERVPKRLKSNLTIKKRKTVLKKGIQPGSVLIVLSGRFMGSRVVFLKQLDSGLLLVTGPYKVNGVPIRRINQAYVIATSTTVDISGVKIPEHIDDKYFARVKNAKEGEEGFFSNQEKINPEWLAKRKEDQKAVDTGIVAAIEKVELLDTYLKTKFTLKNGQAPHAMKF
eukprot:CAMPEP_0171461120 /NCGR_PEP_ID=MMETSP0945-20130129/5701_1 /TAXON_ID=109269 /ORGANISM="Vaucheria litorea, Strain CCMP2940" /LENGTH=221 /DNA_ID=CAMNT_0011987415 /DNA_START=90 /DNA_END=755 /DNA_ORIENTATION=-